MHTILSNLRKNAEYIKALTLSSYHVGIDFAELLDAIQKNTTVSQVACHGKFMARLTACQIAELLAAFANLPKLQELSISLPSNRCHLSANAVECARQAPRLTKLVLKGFDENACLALAVCLESHLSLQDVQFQNGSGDRQTGARVLAEALPQNTSLRNLQLSFAQLTNGDIQAMALALAHNRTLQQLDLRCSTTITNSNHTPVDYSPLVRVLRNQDNESLQTLHTDAPTAIQTELDLYTQIHRSGATQLMRDESAGQQDWLDVIAASHSHDNDDSSLSVLFHTLRQEPRLLLSYDSRRDPQADQHATLRKPTSQSSSEAASVVVVKGKRSSKLRAKAVNAPPCWGLNIPS